MKTKTIFISLKAEAYASEGEIPEELFAGELIYCREAEVGQGKLTDFVVRLKRVIERELGIS